MNPSTITGLHWGIGALSVTRFCGFAQGLIKHEDSRLERTEEGCVRTAVAKGCYSWTALAAMYNGHHLLHFLFLLSYTSIMNDEKNTTNKNPRDEKPGEISAQTFLVVLTVRGTNSNDIQQSCEPDESTTGSMSKVLATRASGEYTRLCPR